MRGGKKQHKAGFLTFDVSVRFNVMFIFTDTPRAFVLRGAFLTHIYYTYWRCIHLRDAFPNVSDVDDHGVDKVQSLVVDGRNVGR